MSDMVTLERVKARTPAEMAKNALKESARTCLAEASWPSVILITAEVDGQVFEFEARPTASLKDGRIMYHVGGKFDHKGLTVSVGGNLLLPTATPDHGEILARYKVTPKDIE